MRRLLAAAAFGTFITPLTAQAEIETSLRAAAWSGARLNTPDDDPFARAEVWLRSTTAMGEALELRTEGWASTDAVGDGGDVEMRQALISARAGKLRLEAGRDVYAWGRTDRINPTDVVSPRDLRRLVDDENDNRRGLATVRAHVELAGGEVSLHWLPEFRASKLPTASTSGVEGVEPDDPGRQFAVR